MVELTAAVDPKSNAVKKYFYDDNGDNKRWLKW
jgi:hypothetical protein